MRTPLSGPEVCGASGEGQAVVGSVTGESILGSANFSGDFARADAVTLQATKSTNRMEELPMASRHLVDPDFLHLLDALPTFDLTAEALPQIRAGLAERAASLAPEPDDSVTVTEQVVPGRDGKPDVRVMVYRPADAVGELPAMLHLHPGGFIMGGPFMRDPRNRYLAKAVGCVIVSVVYRLAPEHPYPAALEDAYTALTWLHAEGATIGADTTRIAISGDSAGGGLAAALAQMAHDKGEVPILFQALTYPMLDNRSGATVDRGAFVGQYMWSADANRFAWQALLGENHHEQDQPPYAVPAHRADLAGLPPTFIAVGALDLFVEEDIDYARRLIHAGVPTELHVYPGAFHGFDSTPQAWSTENYVAQLVSSLKRALHPR